MRHAGWYTLALTCALLAVPARRVLARDDHEQPAEGVAEHGEAEHGHGGPLQLRDVLHSTEFWGAVINFSLLAWLLRRKGAKPLNDFLVNRRREMEREIAAAAAMKAKAEAKFQEFTQRMSQLDSELAKLRKDMERSAQEDRQRILSEADENARRLRRETESLIDQHAKALTASIRREMVGAAVAQAEKLVRESIGDADQQRLAEGFVQGISPDAQAPAHAERARVRAIPQEQS
jgi:F-type H+-transporting ATPase subunit b